MMRSTPPEKRGTAVAITPGKRQPGGPRGVFGMLMVPSETGVTARLAEAVVDMPVASALLNIEWPGVAGLELKESGPSASRHLSAAYRSA